MGAITGVIEGGMPFSSVLVFRTPPRTASTSAEFSAISGCKISHRPLLKTRPLDRPFGSDRTQSTHDLLWRVQEKSRLTFRKGVANAYMADMCGMKGSIVRCTQQLVETKLGPEGWKDILARAGQPPTRHVLDIEDVPDEQVVKLLDAVIARTGLTWTQLADAFGEQWVMHYSQRLYAQLYATHRTAREFLLSMDSVHVMVTKTIKNAHPPRFHYTWKNEKTLHMHYKSSRKLIDFLAGLVRAVGKYYKENLRVTKLAEDCLEIVFAA